MNIEEKHAGNVILLRVACITLIIGLILAWCLMATIPFKIPFFLNIFKDTDELLSAHLDFLMMSMLLFGIYASKIPLPKIVIWPMALGSIGNPSAFLLGSIFPESQSPLIGLFIFTTISLTTFGYGMASIKIMRYSLK